jgi:hypothetical protein
MKEPFFFTSAGRHAIRILVVLLLVPSLTRTQPPKTASVPAGAHRVMPHDTLLSHLNRLAGSSGRFTVERIGTTVQGRSIPMVHVPPLQTGAATTVLVFCQQHGNEPSGKEAALVLLNRIAAGANDALLSHLDLFVIPSVNPDGNESGKRGNANGADLNRDHLLLTQPEVRALHDVFSRVNPEVTLDVHEYSAFRKEFRMAGYVQTTDEQFGAPSNLNVAPAIREYGLRQLFPFLEAALAKRGVRFSNYLRMQAPGDTVRFSTTSIDDGRQSFAILNTFSFIVEGRNGRDVNDELDRRITGQLAAIESFLDFVNSRNAEIRRLVRSGREKSADSTEPVVTQMDYVYDGATIKVPVRTLSSKVDSVVSMAFAPVVKPLVSVLRPEFYVIPRSQRAVRDLLDRHGVRYDTVARSTRQEVEIHTVVDVAGKWMENKPFTYVSTRMRTAEVSLEPGDVVVPLNQPRGTMLVIALEPSSMWGIAQDEAFAAFLVKGSDYPVYRIPANTGKR